MFDYPDDPGNDPKYQAGFQVRHMARFRGRADS